MKKRKNMLSVLFFCLFLLGGCGLLPENPSFLPGDAKEAARTTQRAVAGLKELPPEAASHWRLPENLSSEGTKTFFRVVAGAGLLAPQALELAAGPESRLTYFLDMDSSDDELNYRFQFLSTQGTGRLHIAAVGRDGRTVATVGYVFTGALPPRNGNAVWIDRRLPNNYQGAWVQEHLRPTELFAKQFPSFAVDAVARYRVGIESGNGQHALITELKSAGSQVEGAKILWRSPPRQAAQGEVHTLVSEVVNATDKELSNLTVRLHEPYGYGLIALGPLEQKISRLAAGEKTALTHSELSEALAKPWKPTART